MKWFEGVRHRRTSWLGSAIDTFSWSFSYYAVPIAIAALSVWVMFGSLGAPEIETGTPLMLRVLSDPSGRLDVAGAAAAIGAQPLRKSYDTRLSEAPIWFAAENPGTPANPSAGLATVLATRHVLQMSCFDAATLTPVGSIAPDGQPFGRLRMAARDVAVLPGASAETLCRARFSGPEVLRAQSLPVHALAQNNDIFYRRSGLLEGGLLTLAAFVLLTALVNRDWVYVLFAAWLFGNLRLGAISMGWDDLWLGYPIPLDWVSLIRKVTVPVYYILTGTLFTTMFKHDLPRIGYQRWLQLTLGLGPVLLLASIVLPVPLYLPVMWTIASFAIAVIVFMLARLLAITPSRTAFWYSAALGVTLLSSLSEVASVVFKAHVLTFALNSVTAALISSLMAALAFAEQIRAERTERLRAQAELRHAYEATPIGLFTLGSDGGFVRWNPAFASMLGMRGADARRHWDDYFDAGGWAPIYRQAMEKGAVEIELARDVCPAGDGTMPDDASLAAYKEIVAAPRSGEDLRRHYLVKAAYAAGQLEASVQDVTERHRALSTLSFLADHDPLTGALNRRGIDKLIDGTSHAPNGSAPLIIAYLDLDRFKLLNDLFGHQVGDQVLKLVCLRIEAGLNPADQVCRIGGDEFVILFRTTTIAQAAETAQAIIDAIDREPYQFGQRAFHVRASIGLIEAPPGFRPEEAISAADSACREAKRNGNGRVVVYACDAPRFVERARELNLIERFNHGLPPGLFLEMQPIMSLKAPYESLDFEVLLRMRAPDGSVIPPFKVITAAEANGTISALDMWVMETTLAWIDRHQAKLSRTRFISVNVSGASLNDESFVVQLGELFQRYRHVVAMLCVEITEGVALHDLSNTRRLIGNLQRLGARVAIDDFGAGYTSFPYLRDLPADALKIDGEFIRNLHEFSANAAIVEAMIGLARNLGMQSIAEWVEDASTLALLLEMGVDFVQGFAIARPQAPEVILEATSAADFIRDPEVLKVIGPPSLAEAGDDYRSQSLH